jgi:hypothetical protein
MVSDITSPLGLELVRSTYLFLFGKRSFWTSAGKSMPTFGPSAPPPSGTNNVSAPTMNDLGKSVTFGAMVGGLSGGAFSFFEAMNKSKGNTMSPQNFRKIGGATVEGTGRFAG